MINLVYGIFVFLLAFFPTDPRGTISVPGIIHQYLASIAFPGFLIGYALILISAGNYRNRKFEGLLLGLLMIAFYLVTRNWAVWRGLYQRIFIYGELALVLYYLKRGKLAGNGV
jgi:hypothetical protein